MENQLRENSNTHYQQYNKYLNVKALKILKN